MPNRSRSSAANAPVCTWVEEERLALHKGTGQAYFLLADHAGTKKRFWQGRYYAPGRKQVPDPATLTRAARWLREYRVLGSAPPQATVGSSEMTIAELADRFATFVKGHYPEGSSEHFCNAAIIEVLKQLYGNQPASTFGPLKLKAVRDRLVELKRWNRRTINGLTIRLRRVFKWAASNELLPPSIYEALRTIEGLRQGRTSAREPGKVGPVADASVEAVLPHVSRQVRAMIELQRLTGMRPGELVILRPCDLDRTTPVWTYRPAHHKTEHHGHERFVAIGPKAQAVLAPFLLRPAEEYAFSPVEAERERLEARHAARKTPASCGNVPGSARLRHPTKHPGDRYTTGSYRTAIKRACTKAEVASWHPHQLRHTAATELRRKYGIEAARVALGHTDAKVTEIYAEADRELARKIAAEVG